MVETADNRGSAVRLDAELRPDVVMDMRMPDLNVIDARTQLLAGNAAPRVVALSAEADHRATAAMLQVGAAGYVVKAATFEELVVAVRTGVAWRVYHSPTISGVVVKAYARGRSERSEQRGFQTPSGREGEILQLMAEGRVTKQIAATP